MQATASAAGRGATSGPEVLLAQGRPTEGVMEAPALSGPSPMEQDRPVPGWANKDGEGSQGRGDPESKGSYSAQAPLTIPNAAPQEPSVSRCTSLGPSPKGEPQLTRSRSMLGGACAALNLQEHVESLGFFLHSLLRDPYELAEPNRIDKGLFLGGYRSAQNKEYLKQLKVASILTVASELPSVHSNDFTCTVVEVWDTMDTDIAQHFERCFKVIDEGRAKGGVLVHCAAGVSRSATVVIAYLMRTKQMTLKRAYARVKRIRHIINPNIGFMAQLKKFEDSLKQNT